MPRARETLVVLRQQRLVFVTPDRVHGVAEEAGEMVFVEDDTLVRGGPECTPDRAQVGAGHVHGATDGNGTAGEATANHP